MHYSLKSKKKYGDYVVILGIVLMVGGAVFILQSISIIGPTSSFMYKNRDWTDNGFIIIIIGMIAAIFGIVYTSLSKKNQK